MSAGDGAAASVESAQLTDAEKRAQKMRLTRLQLYTCTATNKMSERFRVRTFACGGLSGTIGDKEVERLDAAIQRHGRVAQFDEMAVPADVLLKTLSYVPNPHDPRLGSRDDADSAADTLYRLATTCSTVMFCIFENKHLLGSRRGPSQHALAAARTAHEQHVASERRRRAGAGGGGVDDDDVDAFPDDDPGCYDHYDDDLEPYLPAEPSTDDDDITATTATPCSDEVIELRKQ